LQTIGFADVLSCVDINRYQRFSLIDHDVTAGFQPDFRTKGLVDLEIESVLLKNGRVLEVQFDAIHQSRLKLVHEIQHRGELGFVIEPDGPEVGRELIAQHSLNEVEIAMN